jgi:inositol hexakisphosphate/diphosphoinositol-pentakisphosphate kinase
MACIRDRASAVFQVVFFGDDVILHQPIADWPVVDVLIAFFSSGFPLDKALQYAALRKPHILNDLHQQSILKDRRKVYDLLEASGIDVPRHVYLSRDGYVSTGTGDGNGQRDTTVVELDDHIECNGLRIHKPFVEKPVNAEDHNISIYYPTSKYPAPIPRCRTLPYIRAPVYCAVLCARMNEWTNGRAVDKGGST